MTQRSMGCTDRASNDRRAVQKDWRIECIWGIGAVHVVYNVTQVQWAVIVPVMCTAAFLDHAPPLDRGILPEQSVHGVMTLATMGVFYRGALRAGRRGGKRREWGAGIA